MGLAKPAAEPCGELWGTVQSTHLRVMPLRVGKWGVHTPTPGSPGRGLLG